ncbi:TolC family protein [Polymorphobacter sp. PAMC 29334]|uniref:TolC family protein n=1 Tax=Polymorphobacter sp. PAMC 29334 TaxID=2862331 RepID=UPI001C67FD3A|nr:TolC family protein [Polymorphobacter sp. PAMC 29334]QYE34669.1 TolC family protein [Polymorphobacter sp. PAMC 29334]
MLRAIMLIAALLAVPAAASEDPRHLMPSQTAPCAADPVGPLTLPDLVDLALCHNPATAVAWAASRSAAAQVGIARAAELPSLSATVGPTLSRTDYLSSQQFVLGNGQSFSATSNSTDFGSSASLALNYLIFDFGGRAARIDSARASQRAALGQVADTAQTVALDTVTAYNSLQANIAATTAAQSTVAFNRSSLDLASGRTRAGVATPADELQARTSLAQAELTLAQARGNARTSAGQLAVVIGLPPTTVLPLAPAPVLASADKLNRDVTVLIADAEKLRPDLRIAAANRDAATAQIRAARSDLLPSLAASAQDNLGYANSTSDSNRASVGLTVTIPFFNGYDRTYRVAAARAEADRQAALFEQTRQQAGLDVFTQATALETQISVLSTARELINSATASADIAQGRFKAGVGTFTDLLNAQSALASARQQLVSADFGVRDAQARLARAIGDVSTAVDANRSSR